MKKAIFPGSFDPFTIGHKDILDQALNVFDEIIIAVGENSSKSCMFSLKDRIRFIEKSIETNSKITVESYSDLTTNFCELKDVKFLFMKSYLYMKNLILVKTLQHGEVEHLQS